MENWIELDLRKCLQNLWIGSNVRTKIHWFYLIKLKNYMSIPYVLESVLRISIYYLDQIQTDLNVENMMKLGSDFSCRFQICMHGWLKVSHLGGSMSHLFYICYGGSLLSHR